MRLVEPEETVLTEQPRTLLIVEDDEGLQRQLKWAFDGYRVLQASNREEAIVHVRAAEPAVVLQDLGLPPHDAGVEEGFATLREILALAPRTKVVVVTGNADRESALSAIGAGAYDFYQKPLDVPVLQHIVERAFRLSELEEEYRALQNRVSAAPLEGILTIDDGMRQVCRTVEKVADSQISVLITGESGTGKELLARALHRGGSRSSGRFVAINCAAIPSELLEAELFGYERGAFTGAVKQTIGKVESAGGGTLFLDEIGDMPMPLQAKMLRFIQERTIERIGGRQEISVDVRLVCATHRDLKAMIAEGTFREDLYYRLGEIVLRVPPLRDRRGDAPVLARELIKKHAAQLRAPAKALSPDALAALERYEWPGNVRELENRIKSAVVLSEGPTITAADLGFSGDEESARLPTLRQVRAKAERQAVMQALALTDGNISRAAELLGVTRPTLYDLIERLNVGDPP
jgi:two-component system NtrC family response regulator